MSNLMPMRDELKKRVAAMTRGQVWLLLLTFSIGVWYLIFSFLIFLFN